MLMHICPLGQKCLRVFLTRPWSRTKPVQNCHSCKNDPSCKNYSVKNCLLVQKNTLVQKRPLVKKVFVQFYLCAIFCPRAKMTSCKSIFVEFCALVRFFPLVQIWQLPLSSYIIIKNNISSGNYVRYFSLNANFFFCLQTWLVFQRLKC